MKLMISAYLFMLLPACDIYSQSSQWDGLNSKEQEIMKVVISIFDGMRAGDSAAVKVHFYPNTSMYSASSENGLNQLKATNIQNWFNAIAKPHEQVWDERIWDYQVQVQGNLSSVWVKYAFYLDQTLHHCGVDAIQLANDGSSWKVFHIADTRKYQDCQIPERIANGATY